MMGQGLQTVAGSSYESLAEKILAARKDAQAHEAIKGIKFQVRIPLEGEDTGSATVIGLSQEVAMDSEEEAQSVVDILNRVIEPELKAMAKRKEEKIRSILGGHA